MASGASGSLSPPDALVWGACGFIGRHLAGELCQRGGRVAVLTRPRERYRPAWWSNRVQWFELRGDDRDEAVMERAVSTAQVIFNLAGSTGAAGSNRDPIRSLDGNNRAQLQMLEASRRAGVRPHMVFTSSRLVYGHANKLPVAEDHPLDPLSLYAVHKLSCEQYHRIYALQNLITCTVVRISNVYGADIDPADKPHGMINACVNRCLDGRSIELFGDGHQLRDYIYIADLVEVLLACSVQPAARNETINVGTGVGISLRDASEQIVAAVGAPPLRFVPWPEDHAVVETGDYVTDVTKMRRRLGCTPQWSFPAGLAQTIAAMRATR